MLEDGPMNVQFVAKFPVSFNTGFLELVNEETCGLLKNLKAIEKRSLFSSMKLVSHIGG
jgi:hypothetical protein